MKAVQLKDVAELKANQATQAASLKRIEGGLFGDSELQVTGLAEKIKESYSFTERGIESNWMQRSLANISFYETWDKVGNWKILSDIIDRYKWIRWLFAVAGITSIIGLVSIASILFDLFSHFNK